MTAPVAKRIIERALVSDRVVIQTLVNKHGSHLPLYRQSATLKARNRTGVEPGYDGWLGDAGGADADAGGGGDEEGVVGRKLPASR